MIYLPKKPKFFGQQLRVGHWSTNGLVFYWRGIQAGNAVDKSFYGNHGTLSGVTWTADGLDFDGSNVQVVIGNSLPELDLVTATRNTISVCAWIRPRLTSVDIIASTGSQTSGSVKDNQWFLTAWTSDNLSFGVGDGTGFDAINSPNNTLVADNWHFVAGTIDSAKLMKMYIDGVVQPSTANFSLTPYSVNKITLLGKNHSSASFNGIISDVKIYDRDLSASEILALYINSNLPIQIESPKSIFYGVSETKDYSRGDESALPGNDDNIETSFTSQDYTDVEVDDGTRVSQTAQGEYAIFLFKNKNDSQENITLNWNGQSDRAPSDSTIYLQIYNRNSTTWENLDSDDETGANTDFDLTGTQSANLSNYFDADFWISWRVYQQAT